LLSISDQRPTMDMATNQILHHLSSVELET
jgi:hypothetical protein